MVHSANLTRRGFMQYGAGVAAAAGAKSIPIGLQNLHRLLKIA
jgi:hypothetical protein